MNIKLKIEGHLVDVKTDSKITLQKKSNVFGSPDKIQTSRSYTITCPFSANNVAFFEHLELPSVANDFLTTAKSASLEADGLPIFNGLAVLLSIVGEGYEIALTFGELTALAAMITDGRKISELGFTEIWRGWENYLTRNNETYENGSDGLYRYNAGQPFSSTYIQRSYAVDVDFIIGKINEYYGIDIQIPTINKKILLAQNLNAKYEGDDESFVLNMSFDWMTGSVGEFLGNFNSNSYFPEIYPYWNSRGGGVKIDKIERYDNFTFKIKYQEDIFLRHFDKDGNLKNSYPVLYSGILGSLPITVNKSTMAEEDIFLIQQRQEPFGNCEPINHKMQLNVTLDDEQILPASDELIYKSELIAAMGLNTTNKFTYMQFPIFANCNFTAIDFLKQIQLLEGLFCTQGNTANELIFKSFDTLGDRTGAQDLTNQFRKLNGSKFELDSFGKQNLFRYAKSDDEITENYNAASFVLNNLQLKDSVGVASIFGTGTNDTLMRINQYTIDDAESYNNRYKINSLPLIWCELEGQNLKSVPFVDILQEKYLTLIKSVQNFRVCELNFLMSNLEYKRFDANKLIYIKKIGKYFYPITADYDLDSKNLKIEAFLLGDLSDDVKITTVPLSLSAQASAAAASAAANNTYALVVNDYVPKTRKLSINGTEYDLSADRSWTIEAGGGEKRFDVHSTIAFTYYIATAPTGTITSATGWEIAKIVQNTNGTTTTTHATGIYDDRESIIYT